MNQANQVHILQWTKWVRVTFVSDLKKCSMSELGKSSQLNKIERLLFSSELRELRGYMLYIYGQYCMYSTGMYSVSSDKSRGHHKPVWLKKE
jgi:hypothetical protein